MNFENKNLLKYFDTAAGRYSSSDLTKDALFDPMFLHSKFIVHVPSWGMPGTNVASDKRSRMLAHQNSEVVAMSNNPGIVVSYLPLPDSENDYREMLFGKRRPKWLNLKHLEYFDEFGENETPPRLDEITLQNHEVLEQIKNIIRKKSTNKQPVLYGYHQTPTMVEIANILNISYYGNLHFAKWAGSKVGLQEFLEKYNLPRLNTLTIYTREDLYSGLEYFKDLGYTHVVIKVNNSTGGLGHRLIEVEKALLDFRKTSFKELLPKMYLKGEGMVMQGFIDRIEQAGQSSLDLLVDFDYKTKLIFLKTKFHPNGHNLEEAGYLPIDMKQYEDTLELLGPLKAAYEAEKAVGSHSVNLMHIKNPSKYGFKDSMPVIHDENSRIGDSKIAHSWVCELRGGEFVAEGWVFNRVVLRENMSFGELLQKLDYKNLLIKRTGPKVKGVMPYNGVYLEKGLKSFYMVAVADDTYEAMELMYNAVSAVD